jgi:integrase
MDLLMICNKYTDFAEKHYAKKTAGDKKSLCRRVLKDWGNILCSQITTEMVQQYLDRQSEIRSSNAYNKDRKNLLAMWAFVNAILKIKSNPVLGIRTIKHDRKPQYVPPVQDILKLLAAATREEKVLLDCYLNTAARKREIFNLTWFDDVNFDQRKIRLGTRKRADGSMEYEWVEMNDSLYESMWWQWNNRPVKSSPYVFVCTQLGRWYGRPYTTRRTFMHSLCDRAGIIPFGFHTLRRFVASYLVDVKKISLKSAQLILRHKTIRTTERYVYSLSQDLKQEYAMLNDLQVQDENKSKQHVTAAREKTKG